VSAAGIEAAGPRKRDVRVMLRPLGTPVPLGLGAIVVALLLVSAGGGRLLFGLIVVTGMRGLD
jgi:hypothetical protein